MGEPSLTTLWRWRGRWHAEGLRGLQRRKRIARGKTQSAIEAYQVTPEIIAAVSRLAGTLGSVRLAWRRYAKLKECPWRLAIYLRKRGKRLPASLLNAVKLDEIPARAFLVADQVFIHLPGRVVALSKERQP